MNGIRCGICNVDVDDWDEHQKSEQHQKYLNDPTLMNRLFSENMANTMRMRAGIKQVKVKPVDQIDTFNPEELWNWHVIIRDSGSDYRELRENIICIFTYLVEKYGYEDYRTARVARVFSQRGEFDIESLEAVRYIIHAESEGITHETDEVHGHWLKSLKRKSEINNEEK